MLERLQQFFTPGTAGSLAALLVALGVETDTLFLHHAFEAFGALIGALGVLVGLFGQQQS